MVAIILWVGMAALDICAWFWYIWDLVAAIFGKLPPRCTVLCRCVVDNTVSPRVLCSQQCCLPADHGPAFHHCCRVHLRYGGQLSQDEMDSWYAFSWCRRVYKKARRLVAATYRLMNKWRIVQLTVLGSLAALCIVVQTGPTASMPRERDLMSIHN